MPKHVTLLRGINVGKLNRISKAELSDLYCPDDMGRARLPNFEEALRAQVTFRNVRVCEKLLALA